MTAAADARVMAPGRRGAALLPRHRATMAAALHVAGSAAVAGRNAAMPAEQMEQRLENVERRTHFDVVAEGLRDDIRLAAEAVAVLSEGAR